MAVSYIIAKSLNQNLHSKNSEGEGTSGKVNQNGVADGANGVVADNVEDLIEGSF